MFYIGLNLDGVTTIESSFVVVQNVDLQRDKEDEQTGRLIRVVSRLK